MEDKGTLSEGEYHPAAKSAMIWYRSKDYHFIIKWKEAFASTALLGNRLADVCLETMRRLESGEAVSDRYLLGLVWTMSQIST